jgi:hypothetical protein
MLKRLSKFNDLGLSYNINGEYENIDGIDFSQIVTSNELAVKMNVIFFLGAGVSVPAKISDMVSLWKKLVEDPGIRSEFRNCLNHIQLKIDNPNIEKTLKLVELLEQTFDESKPFLSDKFTNLPSDVVSHIKNKTLSEVIKEFIIDKIFHVENVDYLVPLKEFTKNNNLKIFTTNYDLVVEKYCNDYNIKCNEDFSMSGILHPLKMIR